MLSVILPTRGRPQQARRCVERLFGTVAGHEVEVVAVADGDAESARALIDLDPRVAVYYCHQAGAVRGWNFGASCAKGDILMLAGDDLWWGNGWLTAALAGFARLPGGVGVVGVNDCHRNAGSADDFATHYLASRQWLIEHYGGVLCCPHYRSYYIDIEMTRVARQAHAFYWAEDAVVEHRHHTVSKAERDATYRLAEPNYRTDAATYAERCAAGFPVDWEPILEDL